MLASVALAALALVVPQAAAHGGVTSWTVGGVNYQGWQPYNGNNQAGIGRPWPSYDPITSVSSGTLSCNGAGTAGPQQSSATVAAGGTVTGNYAQWTHSQGPVTVWMAKCNGACTSNNSNSLRWFKIKETGLLGGTLPGTNWGQDQILKTLKWSATVPSALAAGEYLIRFEILAIHTSNQPQFYPECAQLIVTGGGGKTPSGSYLVSFPGAYSANDPSININIYSTENQSKTTYTIPGPPVWNGQ